MEISKNNFNIKFLKILLELKYLKSIITLIAKFYKFVDEVIIISLKFSLKSLHFKFTSNYT